MSSIKIKLCGGPRDGEEVELSSFNIENNCYVWVGERQQSHYYILIKTNNEPIFEYVGKDPKVLFDKLIEQGHEPSYVLRIVLGIKLDELKISDNHTEEIVNIDELDKFDREKLKSKLEEMGLNLKELGIKFDEDEGTNNEKAD